MDKQKWPHIANTLSKKVQLTVHAVNLIKPFLIM